MLQFPMKKVSFFEEESLSEEEPLSEEELDLVAAARTAKVRSIEIDFRHGQADVARAYSRGLSQNSHVRKVTLVGLPEQLQQEIRSILTSDGSKMEVSFH